MMRHDREPWKWPLATGLALLVLLLVVAATPRRWLPFGRGPLVAKLSRTREAAPWLALLPPPDVLVVPVPEQRSAPPPPLRTPPERLADPRWWSRAWRIRAATEWTQSLIPAAPADSTAWLRRELGLAALPPLVAPADSLLARRLALLKLHDAERFEELKPYFHAAARANQYRDLMSRVNAMYDDFLHSEIMVPD